MQFSHKHCMGDYEFFLTTKLCANELHRGLIVFMKVEGPAALQYQSVTISTPAAFKSVRAAEIEASAYAHELVASKAIDVFFHPKSTPLAHFPP